MHNHQTIITYVTQLNGTRFSSIQVLSI